MHVTQLGLVDFRSYAKLDVSLQPGATVVVGLNGQGKTNLVESLVYLAFQSSHRVARDNPLIRAGCTQAVISARVRWSEREQSVELEINEGRPNRARVAGAPRRPREALGLLRLVLFAPEDLALVKGDPGGRRAFLDEFLVSLTPRLAGVLQDYERVVRQRSALLKSLPRGAGIPDTLTIWDAQLAELGSQVVRARLAALAQLAEPLRAAYEAVAPHSQAPSAVYQSSWLPPHVAAEPHPQAVAEAILAAIDDQRRAELDRGLTLVGPHRDDVLLSIGELPAKGYASHGESWSLALALKLATYEVLKASFDTGGDPVLVLDDVFAELDAERRERLAELVAAAEQVIVTAAVAADVPAALRGRTLSVTRDGDSQVSW